MEKRQTLAALLGEPGRLIEVSQDIFSVIPESEQDHHYDETAAMYDRLIGNRVYNRLVWGAWPSTYTAFAAGALASREDGPVLDAGCGTLVFTAKLYCTFDRPLVLMDRSLGMLRRGRERLIKIAGSVPENVMLLQGDIFDLPFRNGCFPTVQSFGVLHIFERTDLLLRELDRVRSNDGSLFLSSLAANGWFAKRYLAMLKKRGEVALIEPGESLLERVRRTGIPFDLEAGGNWAYFSSGR